MSIRFAAPRHAIRNRMEHAETHFACLSAANDNGKCSATRSPRPLASLQVGDATLHAALRHFAQHGLAAAHHACAQAEDARKAGDSLGYDWWLEICRALDRRMARELDRQVARQ